METIAEDLFAWHQRLHQLRIDLVGDYAGRELFFVEGDSLLRLAFSDERIDMDEGFQLLHAIYVIECFLANLKKRKCAFHVVFFEEHSYFCIPTQTSSNNYHKYLFARSAAIRHLFSTSDATAGDDPFRIFHFQSPDDKQFQQYLETTRPYFVMCHDGVDLDPLQFLLKGFIWKMITGGYNVALINEVEFRDSKVMTVIVQGGPRTTFGAREIQQFSRALNDQFPHGSLEVEYQEKFPRIPGDTLFSERELLAVVSVSAVLRGSDLSMVEISYAATFLLHIALLNHLSLQQRSFRRTRLESSERRLFNRIVGWVIYVSRHFLSDKSYQQAASKMKPNIHDYLDGRLLEELQYQLESGGVKPELLPAVVLSDFSRMAKAIKKISGCLISLPNHAQTNGGRPSGSLEYPPKPAGDGMELVVLPFSNPTFDVYLSEIKIAVDSSPVAWGVTGRNKSFRETTHWHKDRPLDTGIGRPLQTKIPTRTPPRWVKNYSTWIAGQAKKSEQFAFSRMTKYAASLVGAKGKMLEPIVITNNPVKGQLNDTKDQSMVQVTGKKEKPKSKTMSKKDIIRAENTKKIAEKGGSTVHRMWQTLYRDLHLMTDEEAKILKLDQFLNNIDSSSSEKGSVVEVEVRLYKIWMLQRIWAEFCRADARANGYQIVAIVFDETRKILASDGLTKRVNDIVKNMFQAFGISMPPRGCSDALLDSKISFSTTWNGKSVADIGLRMTSIEFQLRHCGLYMDRDMDQKPDPRVSFVPDGWQRKVLDEIDRNNSVFVVAPTSSGKTFISFYAMEKILRSGDDSVLVYVAPTKALVNQIAAEVMARFRKTYTHAGKTVWAIHTRDHRINNSTSCQILVTLPHILQILLLSPSNANTWSRRVKRIIFDEIHCIGQAEDGVVWEQLLLLAPCPIIALSATVGNPEEFSSWMRTTQESLGTKLTMVQHQHRYSDLRKSIFSHPGAEYKFTGLKVGSGFDQLESSACLIPVHPIASLADSSRGMPDDLALEPRDCLSLYEAMKKHSTRDYPLKKSLDPELFFRNSPVIHKVDVIRWEIDLKAEFQHWMESPDSPFTPVIRELGGQIPGVLTEFRHEDRKDKASNTNGVVADEDEESERALEVAVELASDLPTLLKSTMPLLDELNRKNALPAILFSYDRGICDRLCHSLWLELRTAEVLWKQTSPEWQATLRKWTEHVEAKNSRAAKKQAKAAARNEEGTKEERIRERVGEGSSFFDTFDPKDPLPQFSFADRSKYSDEELKEEFRYLGRVTSRLPRYTLFALRRGIGIHHSGLNRKYLHTVEMLFRKGFLRVVIATGTLSLGINMPCKTVVFAGDSVWLTALNFRQASGRAGRRGFDNLGNVVFLGVPTNKARLLISSKLPSLTGHFPITTSLVLRLFNLLHDSSNSTHATTAINGILSQPRLYLGGDSFKDQVLHHLRFSIEYLRRQKLLGPSGEPLNFAGITGHLYYTENSSFAFHALLRAGFFHSLCADIAEKPHRTCMAIMLVMAHLFHRHPCRGSDPVRKLPPLPRGAIDILEKHNKDTLHIYTNYVKTFAAEHCQETADNTLPFSRAICGQTSAEIPPVITHLPPAIARSSFAALSGLGDTFTSIPDLTDSVRAGIFLEKSAVPHLSTGETMLNSFLLDFYRHGEIPTLIRQNQIRRSDIWFELNGFSLVLATIITSLANYMKGGEDEDAGDVVGLGDIEELVMEDQAPVVGVSGGEEKEGEGEDESHWGSTFEYSGMDDREMSEAGLGNVLLGFRMLKATFDEKFKAMWA